MPRSERRTALAVLCAGALMAIVDETVVAVSLPAIQADLGFSKPGLAWVTGAYLIAFAGLLLLGGRLGDLLGRQRVFSTGLAVFTGSSMMCGLAWSPAALVFARFVQGAGGAAMTSVILGMITTLFEEPAERAKALGAFGFVQASGGTIGMLVGGVVTDLASWHWIFFLNAPVGVVSFVLARKVLARERVTGRLRRADLPGAVLVTSALMTGIYAITGAEEHGWVSIPTLVAGGAALVLLTGFGFRQCTAADPLLPPRLLRSRVLVGANAVLLLLVASMFGFMFATVLTMQQVLGFTPRETGFAMVPAAVTIAIFSLGITPRLLLRIGERASLRTGLVVLTGGLAILARMPADAHYATDILPALVLLGAGFGTAMPALLALGMAQAPQEDAGLASGLFNTTQQIGGAAGLSTLLVLAAAHTRDLLATGAPGVSGSFALLSGYRVIYVVAIGLVLAALAVTATLLRHTTTRTARDPVSA